MSYSEIGDGIGFAGARRKGEDGGDFEVAGRARDGSTAQGAPHDQVSYRHLESMPGDDILFCFFFPVFCSSLL